MNNNILLENALVISLLGVLTIGGFGLLNSATESKMGESIELLSEHDELNILLKDKNINEDEVSKFLDDSEEAQESKVNYLKEKAALVESTFKKVSKALK